MSDIPTISELASEAHGWFTTTTRADETIDVLRDGAPTWIYNLVFAAHESGEIMPDDWRYASIRSALAEISDSDADDRDDLDDLAGEWADSNVDVYTGARIAWLGSRMSRTAYVDEAVDELGGEGLDTVERIGLWQYVVERIGLGQYVESREVFELVANALEDEREARADD